LCLSHTWLFLPDSPISKNSKDKVFRHMTQFSNDGVQELDFLKGQPGREKSQERNDNTRRLVRSKSISRKREDDEQPKDEGRPIFNGKTFH
jgi:hypothetical protein